MSDLILQLHYPGIFFFFSILRITPIVQVFQLAEVKFESMDWNFIRVGLYWVAPICRGWDLSLYNDVGPNQLTIPTHKLKKKKKRVKNLKNKKRILWLWKLHSNYRNGPSRQTYRNYRPDLKMGVGIWQWALNACQCPIHRPNN